MELTLWTYEGPPHVGAMRIAASMKGVHYVLHAPQGDTYADLLFTMIERRGKRPPVTYTTFQARDLGGDTAELVKRHIREAVERFKPDALVVGRIFCRILKPLKIFFLVVILQIYTTQYQICSQWLLVFMSGLLVITIKEIRKEIQ